MPGLSSLPASIRSLRPVKTLEANLQKGRMPHAILLKGDHLATLESVAKALAGALLESSEKPESHPDYFTLRPSGKSRTIVVGKRNEEKSNTVRLLIRELNQSSNQGGYKVAVIHEADRMNGPAANAFLKTLEEPPPQTIILLLTTRPYDVIETIRSRCFQFMIPLKSLNSESEEWKTWLTDYRDWIIWLHRHPEEARRQPDKVIFIAYGLIARFVSQIEEASSAVWEEQKATLPESMESDEMDAFRIGMLKGIRDNLLIDIEENTRLAAIQLSHHVPFPSQRLAQAIQALESTTGLLALNMRDDTALEGFFLQSLKIWTR